MCLLESETKVKDAEELQSFGVVPGKCCEIHQRIDNVIPLKVAVGLEKRERKKV